MFTIVNTHNLSSEPIHCSECKQDVVTHHHWSVNGKMVCDSCFSEKYAELVKCKTEDCNRHCLPEALHEGLCAGCDEISIPE